MDEMVEVVIRIPKEQYDYICNGQKTFTTELCLLNAVCTGITLPKGHGRLIDADAINIHDVSPAYGMEVYGVTQDDLEYEPTVIEASKGE